MTAATPLSILHTESSLGWGGQEIRILTEMEGCAARGHRVLLLAPCESQIHAAAARRGLAVEPLRIARKRLPDLLAVRRWLKAHAHRFDVLNTHSSTDSWLAALALGSLGRPLPMVRTRHVSTAIGAGAATQWLYRRATTHIVTTGEALRQQLHRDHGIPLESMTSVRTGIDLARFRRADRRDARRNLGLEEAPTVGILATLRDWKGHRHLIEAFAMLRTRAPELFGTWRLLIVGDGPERGRLEDFVNEQTLQSRVHFAGNRDDAPAWLAAMDIFVLPSYGNEGVPQGIMQAMACGLPVIATPVGAVREAVLDGVTGRLTTPRNIAELCGHLIDLMRDAPLRESLGHAAWRHAQAHFGIDVMIDRMLEVFGAAVARHRQGRDA